MRSECTSKVRLCGARPESSDPTECDNLVSQHSELEEKGARLFWAIGQFPVRRKRSEADLHLVIIIFRFTREMGGFGVLFLR